jgi:hypothetical protein
MCPQLGAAAQGSLVMHKFNVAANLLERTTTYISVQLTIFPECTSVKIIYFNSLPKVVHMKSTGIDIKKRFPQVLCR